MYWPTEREGFVLYILVPTDRGKEIGAYLYQLPGREREILLYILVPACSEREICAYLCQLLVK